MAKDFEESKHSRGILSAVDVKLKMDALVSDLTHALDESQLIQSHRKRRSFKRRTGGLGSHCPHIPSDDSSSSLGEISHSHERKSSLVFSDDSDEITPAESQIGVPRLVHHRIPNNIVESDSVNENISPARLHNKRKQKCKRLALDLDASCGTLDRSSFHSSLRRKRSSKPSPDSETKDVCSAKFRFIQISAGKRKRGRDKNMDWDSGKRWGISKPKHTTSGGRQSKHLLHSHHSISSSDCMDLEYQDKHLNESSSESEAGIFTCDEGREADDEQSDWFAEPGAVYGVPGEVPVTPGVQGTITSYKGRPRLLWWNGDSDMGVDSSTRTHYKENFEKVSTENQQSCRLRFQKLRERLLRREIRAGRRRLQERRPGFSIISSVNQKVSRFLQDPSQSELRLKPMTDRDRTQLWHLARLYSLNLRPSDDVTAAPILTKTRNTITTTSHEHLAGLVDVPVPGGAPAFLGDLKRRRRTTPSDSQNHTEGSNDSIESVVLNSAAGPSSGRPPVPTASWEDDVVADSLSERLADSEPDPVPSPTSLALHHCTL